MKTLFQSACSLILVAACTISSASAAPKTYQVTGPVLEVNDTMIAVQKGKERWELARTPATKVTGDLKVGSKATVEYSMTANSVEAKAEKAAKETKGDKPAKK